MHHSIIYADEEGEQKNGGYIGYGLLFAIPVVGLICILIFSFSSTYPCRRNYARSALIGIIIAVALVLIYSLATGVSIMNLYNNIRYFNYRYY